MHRSKRSTALLVGMPEPAKVDKSVWPSASEPCILTPWRSMGSTKLELTANFYYVVKLPGSSGRDGDLLCDQNLTDSDPRPSHAVPGTLQ